ncbi:MAG: hypothetical protein GY866_33420 [Proteobacteria bacterium]|nr:hypothetical protein [Pseudomonadota bacterium]
MEALPEIDWENKNRKVIAAVNRLLYDAFPKAPKGSIRAYKSQVLKDWSEKHQGG